MLGSVPDFDGADLRNRAAAMTLIPLTRDHLRSTGGRVGVSLTLSWLE